MCARESTKGRKKNMEKAKIIETMRKWYMPNFFDIEMFDYTKLNDKQVYEIYWGECDTYTKEEVDGMLEEHI